MANDELVFTLWDVGHGVSIWINTPDNSNHWIDLGRTPNFSPSQHVGRTYGVSDIDCLFISHPDKDHLEDLPQFRATFGDPRVLHRNKSLPAADMFGQRAFQYQNDYAISTGSSTPRFPTTRARPIPTATAGPICHPLARTRNPCGRLHSPRKLSYRRQQHVHRRHAVLPRRAIRLPGDIEPLGWRELWKRHGASYRTLINDAHWRFLVAPHHGRKSGYCKDMMDTIRPHATFISDVWGDSEDPPGLSPRSPRRPVPIG